MRSQLYSLLKFLIGWPLTVLALLFIAKIIIPQAPALLHTFHTIHYFLLLYGILSFIIFYFIRSYLWYRILTLYGYSISLRESSYLWALSELKRYIPGNIWSFLGRTVLFQQKNVRKKDIAKGIIIEAELFVIGSVIVSLLSLQFYFSSQYDILKWFLTILIFGLAIAYCFTHIFITSLSGRFRTLAGYLFSPFTVIENSFLIWISMLALFFFGMGNYLIITSVVYLNPKLFLELIGVFDLAFVTGYLSVITPAGFGVREGIIIFSLTKIISYGFAAFGSLFSRIILICSELIFIGINTLWYRLHTKYTRRLEKIISKHPQVSILTVLTAIYMLYFTIVSFLRYDNYYTGRFDLGNMAQTVWNSLHGRIFLFTNPNGTEQISRLAFHADFILVLMAPLYALWQNPKMLLLIQTIVVAAGAYFVYIIARDVLKHRNLALVFSFAYLLNPSIQRANIYDFHAVTFVTTFFLATYYFFMKRRYVWFIIFSVLAALCKEQIWFTVALFGLLTVIMHKKYVIGVPLFLFGLAMFYFLFWYAIPHTQGGQQFALAYLSRFGDSPTQVVKGVIFSPGKIIQIITHPAQLDYLNQIFLPLGYLIIGFPFFLLFAGQDLLIDLLSSNPQLHQIYYQYTATITPFIFLSSIYSIYWLRKIKFFSFSLSQATWNFIFIVYLLAFSLIGAYAFGPLPGSRDPNLDMFIKQVPDQAYIENYIQSIPIKYSVAASNDLGSHLSLRKNIYTIPYGLNRADVIVLLLRKSDPQANVAYKEVQKNPYYYEVAHKNGFVAFQRK